MGGGDQEPFTEGRRRKRVQYEMEDIKENVSETEGLGGAKKRVNKVQKGKEMPERQRERDVKGRRQQQSEFIFINGQRAERELLKKRER